MIGYSSFGGGFGGGFEIMFFLVFAIVIGTFIFSFISGISQWNKNNQSPRLTVEARVVTKREDVGGVSAIISLVYILRVRFKRVDKDSLI